MSELLEDIPYDVEDTKLEMLEEAFLNAPACCDDVCDMDEYQSIDHTLRTLGTPHEVEEVSEEIQTNLWLSVQYRCRGAKGLAKECAQAAFDLWRAYYDVLGTCFSDDGKRLRFVVVRRAVNHKCAGATRELLH